VASTSSELFEAIGAADADRVQAILAEDPGLATARDDDGVSALMRARYRFDRASVRAIREHVPELDLFEAAAFGDLDRITEILMYDPAAVEAYSGDGFTALHLAAFFGQAEATRLLLVHAADPDATGRGWMTGTALNSAASARHADVIRILIDGGADPDAAQSGGWTPLHAAARNGDRSSVAILLAAGADAAAVNDDGTSVQELAAQSGDPGVIQAIEAALAR
jgi:ankyrin repeat protein